MRWLVDDLLLQGADSCDFVAMTVFQLVKFEVAPLRPCETIGMTGVFDGPDRNA